MKEAVFDRFFDRSMRRELNIPGAGGLLSIPSTNLEPRMDASAKVRTALPPGICLPHLAHSHYRDLQLADLSADLQEVVTQVLETNQRAIFSFSECHMRIFLRS